MRVLSDEPSSTERLIYQAVSGDGLAMNRLLKRYRNRLKRLVAVRMSDEVRARVDASDIVQDVMSEAAVRLEVYGRPPDAPFYVWLRQIAVQRIIDTTRRHVGAESRSVRREQSFIGPLPDQSALKLAERLVASGTNPSNHLRRKEMQKQVRSALAQLRSDDREILILRYLEQLRPGEIAETLGISDRSVRARHRQALDRMLELLASTDADHSA